MKMRGKVDAWDGKLAAESGSCGLLDGWVMNGLVSWRDCVERRL